MSIDNLSCSRVLYFFEEISKIPRGSGNEKQISDYLVKFANDRNLFCNQDEALNVIIKKKGSYGYENSPAVILQGHMDMVCEKNSDVEHDFEKDPIEVIYEGDFIKANGTTLGADDGIAVAMSLALLDCDDIPHPPIEVIFTTNEEVGMFGAEALDVSLLSGKTLINIDSEDEGIFTAGCAGGMRAISTFKIEFERQSKNFESYKIVVNGLRGGHSGIDIDKERANANRLIARVLNELRNKFDVRINSVSGGAKDNAIARQAQAVISFEQSNYNSILEEIKEIENAYKNEYRNTDGNISLKIYKTENRDKCFTKDFSDKIVSAIMLIPNGVQSMSTDVEGLPESSNNLGVVNDNGSEIELVSAVRSAVVSKKYFIFEQIKLLTEVCGGSAVCKGDYPAWEFNPNSNIRNTFVKLYKEMFNSDATINIIHAGLECGLFAKKLKNADMISFGPNLYDVHTPEERASISSIERTWNFLLSVLKSLK